MLHRPPSHIRSVVLAGLSSLLVACVLVFDTTIPLGNEADDGAERADGSGDDTDATAPDASALPDSASDDIAQDTLQDIVQDVPQDAEQDTTPEPGDTSALQDADADADPGGDVAPDADAGTPPTDAAEVRDSEHGDVGAPLPGRA